MPCEGSTLFAGGSQRLQNSRKQMYFCVDAFLVYSGDLLRSLYTLAGYQEHSDVLGLDAAGLARELLANSRGDLGAEHLDGAHHLLMRNRADADLRHEALVAEELVLKEDLLCDLLRVADHKRTTRLTPHLELLAAHWTPAALAADPVHHRGVGREVFITYLLGCLGHVDVRVDAYR